MMTDVATLRSVRMTSGKPRLIIDAFEPLLSDDGNRVFFSALTMKGRDNGIFLVSLENPGKVRQIVPPDPDIDATELAMSSNGSFLVFVMNDGEQEDLVRIDLEEGWLRHLGEGSGVRRLTWTEAADEFNPIVSWPSPR
jgi:hypothetical protein